MFKSRFQKLAAALLIASLVVTSVAGLVSAAPAEATQLLEAKTVTGTLPGGQFAKVWLGLRTEVPGQVVRLVAEWDRSNPEGNGVGFYVLNEQNLAAVVGGSQLRTNNMAAATALSGSDNQMEVRFQGGSEPYTVVVFNDSGADARFTLTAENAVLSDDGNQVTDPNAPAAAETPADETADTPAEEAAPVAEEAAPAETVTSTETVTTTMTTTTTAPAAEPVAPAATAESTVTMVAGTPGVVRAESVQGELLEQDSQHYLGLEPSARDATITLRLTFDPQDSQELSRRLNFWVLDEQGFRAYVGGNSRLSSLAIGAGSSTVETAPNERVGQVTVAGMGTYTVIVYNSSNVPATYTLTATNALLVDDSGQTLTAQRAMTGTVASTATVAAPAAAAAVTATAATTGTAATTTTGRQGEPGGTYTVQAGDSLSLIARDIYGNLNLYQAICDYNGLANCDTIEVGDVLRLPTQAQIDAGVSAAPAAAPAAAAAPVAATTAATDTTDTAEATAPAAGTAVTSTTGVTSTTATTPTTGAATAPAAADDIVDTLIARGNFRNLVAALDAAGMVDTLRGAGPYTLFAPTDAAFAALPAGAVQQLMADPGGQLTDILQFHVTRGELDTAQLTPGMEVQTLEGASAEIQEGTAGDLRINGAAISVTDIVASNGVIHVIDAVILPPN